MSKFDTHGGYFAPKDYLKVNEGGSHEENPNGGVQVGVDPEGTPNLLEEGEPVYKDYVYSDNIEAEREFLEQNNLPGKYEGKLYSKIADDILTEAEERPLDPISRNGLEALLGRLADAQEGQKQAKEQRELEDELANLSPEELDQLEQMLAQEQPVGTDNPMYGEGPVVAQGEMGVPPEQVVGPAEPMPVGQMPLMADGGNLFRGGGKDRKKQKMLDSVTADILSQSDYNGRATGINNKDLPLIDLHPELDVALMAAQPGGLLAKTMAPSVYRGMLTGLANGEGAQAIIYGLSPETKEWVEISRRAADMQAGNSSKYALYKAVGKGEHLPSPIASRKANLVERGITPEGEPYVVRVNEFADPKELERRAAYWRNEGYSGPDSWANSGSGSWKVRGHANGGTLLHAFDTGGPKKSMADEVKDAILARAGVTGRASGVGNTDYPLVGEHPEMDAALAIIQPGGVVAKALAPSAYRGIINGLANGDPAYTLGMPIGPFKPIATASELASGTGGLWSKVRQYAPELQKLESDLASAKKARRALRFGKGTSTQIANADAEIKRLEYNLKSVRASYEDALRHARELNPVESAGGEAKPKATSEPAPAAEPIPAPETSAPAESTPAPQSTSPAKPSRWRSAWQGAATGAAITGGMMLGNYLSNLETDLRTSNDYSDVGDDLDVLFAPADTTKTQQSGNLIQLRNGGNLFYNGGPGHRGNSRFMDPLPVYKPNWKFLFEPRSQYYNNDDWSGDYNNPYGGEFDPKYSIVLPEGHHLTSSYNEEGYSYPTQPIIAPPESTGSSTANSARTADSSPAAATSGSTAATISGARTASSPVASNPALIGNGDEIDPRELMPSAANGWSFWMPLTETGGSTGGYSAYGSRASSGTSPNYIPYRPEIDGEAFEAEEDYKNFLAHMLAVHDKEEAKQWMQYIQDEIARAGSKYKLKDFQNWYNLATDKRVGPVHQATKAVAQRLAQMRQMRANQLNIADGLRANALTGVADPNLVGTGQPESSFVPVLPLSLPSKGALFDVNTTTGYRPENATLGLPEFKLDNPLQTSGVDAMDPLGRKKSKWETSVDGVEIGHPNPFASSADDQSGSGANSDDDKRVRSPYLSTMPRYAGAAMAGLLGLYNAFQQPDRYNIPHYNPTLPQGQLHLLDPVYNPLDQEQAVNSVLASSAGMNRRIVNSGIGPSVGATLLASDYNAGQNMGTARQTVWDANNQRRNAVIAAKNQNAGTLANFDYGQSRDRAQILNDAAMRNLQNDLIRQRLNYESEGQKYAAIQSNLDTIAQALAGIGQENRTINAINSNNALYHLLSPNGIGAYKSWPESNNAEFGGEIERDRRQERKDRRAMKRILRETTPGKPEAEAQKRRERQNKIDRFWAPPSPSEIERLMKSDKNKRKK